MTLRHNEIIIDVQNPFANCKLDRKQYADILTSVVSDASDGFVLAINNEWGRGKTTFVKMWEKDLKLNDFKTLYFNAWENDFENDVLIALISELEKLKDSKPSQFFDDMLNTASALTKKALPILVKGLVKKVAGDEVVEEFASAMTEGTLEEIQKDIDSYRNRKSAIQKFKEKLERFVSDTNENKPVIFIIDELDRCRPNYAVEVLENIKHLFSVKGIVFVLSIDKVQLGHAIRGVYGSDKINAEEYLRRFIDIEYQIPEPDIATFISYLYDYFEFDSFLKLEERANNQHLKGEGKTLKDFAIKLYSKENKSLRQIEKTFARIRLVLRSFDKKQYVLPTLVIILDYLKENHSKVFNNVKTLKYDLQEFVDEIETVLIKFHPLDSFNIHYIEAMLIKFYFNDWRNKNYKSKQTIFLGDTPTVKLGFNSKMNDNDKLGSGLLNISNDYNKDDIKLSYLITKYELMENIVN